MKSWALLLSVASLLGCQNQNEQRSVVWTKEQGPRPPTLFQSEQFATPQRSVWVMGEVVKHHEQKWGPARIEGGSLHTIENKKGELQFGRASYEVSPEATPTLNIETLNSLYLKKNLFFEKLKTRHTWITHQELLAGPDLVVSLDSGRPEAFYSIDLLNRKHGQIERHWFATNLNYVRSNILNAHFDIEAWVFTPQNLSQIQAVLFQNLLENKELKSRTHVVRSQASQVTLSEGPLRFNQDDPRFDQIQAFYYIQKGVDFFAKELDFTIPVAIEAETFLGFPDKRNAAITYQNQIRFGTGDGVTYHRIAQDPSIVIHEVGHVVVDTIARLSTQGEAGSLNEAFADFFSASYLNSPKMGSFSFLKGPYKRNLEDLILRSEKTGGLYHDSQIVSGTLWELRTRLGKPKAEALAMKSLARLGGAGTLDDFLIAIEDASRELLDPKETIQLREVLKKRQWVN